MKLERNYLLFVRPSEEAWICLFLRFFILKTRELLATSIPTPGWNNGVLLRAQSDVFGMLRGKYFSAFTFRVNGFVTANTGLEG